MITRLLYLCGLYLGPETDLMGPHDHDNPEGYWENLSIYDLNEAILTQLGAAWNNPPVLEEGWWERAEFDALREQAKKSTAELTIRRHWGWKDPRNSLTLPFWQNLFPDLKLIVCIRHPLEVAVSLNKANSATPIEIGLRLWQKHHECILRWRRNYIITHYISYFCDPESELKRVLSFVGLQTPDIFLHQATNTISKSLHRNTVAEINMDILIPEAIQDLYTQFCAEAGPVFRLANQVHD